MGHSLAAGIRGLAWSWAVIGLLDMPYVQTTTLEAMLDVVSSAAIPGIVRFELPNATQPAHPIAWHQQYFSQLADCTGDEGGKQMLQENIAALRLLPTRDPGVCKDIDTKADIEPLS